MKYNIIITDVTNYGATLFCVAGWDLEHKSMIRPEPSAANASVESSRFWGSDLAGPGRSLAPGNVVSFDADNPPPHFPYPHATEDRVVTSAFEVIDHLSPHKMTAAVAHGLSKTIAGAFHGLVPQQNGKLYVSGGTQGPSLSAVQLNSSQVRFYVDEFSGKKKLRVKVQEGLSTFDLGVTSDELRSKWQAAGVGSLNELSKKSDTVHLRLGLARPFPKYQCFAQMNGAYFS